MKNKEHTKARRLRLIEQGLCTQCGKAKAIAGKKRCEMCLKYHVEYNRKHSDKIEPVKKLYRKKLRVDVVQKYGGRCSCCGESRIEFLAIDHKNNDGNKERIEKFGSNRNASSYSWYLELKREDIRDDLQVLCHNCNIAKSFYGRCPHQDDLPEYVI